MVLTGKCVTRCGLAVFTGLSKFVAYKALDAAIGMHRLIQFTKKSGGGRGRLQIFCARTDDVIQSAWIWVIERSNIFCDPKAQKRLEIFAHGSLYDRKI